MSYTVRDALDLIDAKIQETANAANEAARDHREPERLGGLLGCGIRIQILDEIKRDIQREYAKDLEDALARS